MPSATVSSFESVRPTTDRRSVLRQRLGDSLARTLASAGDDRRLAGERTSHRAIV
jgi:hypothetical protein